MKNRANTITGGLLVIDPSNISMVTTDGHRLAHITRNSSTFNVPEKQETLISAAALDRLKPFLAGEVITFSKNEDGLQFFSVGSYTITSRKQTGNFPNYNAVLPKDGANAKVITLDSKQFAAAIGRVSQFANERSMACKFELLPNQGVCVSASSADSGSASELVKAPMRGFCFNWL